MLKAGWYWSAGAEGGGSTLVVDNGDLVAEEVSQALLEVDGELPQLLEGGEEWGGEGLRQECEQYCCRYKHSDGAAPQDNHDRECL